MDALNLNLPDVVADQYFYRQGAQEAIRWAVRFALQPGEREKLSEERAKILAIRHEKHPDLSTHPCAGSFFRNVEPTSKAEKRQAAGWFLEQAGGKDLKIGGALIFEKHANIIVKGPQCTADDVYQLSCKMQQIVKEKFHFDLVREVRFVGKINSLPKNPSEMFW